MQEIIKTFHPYLKAVGTGPKGNKDLNNQEMHDALEMILEAKATPAQSAAFLLGWRLKPESIQEFRASLSLFESYIQQTPIANSIELGYPYDGKVKNPYLFPEIAKLLKPFDIHLVLSTDQKQPSKEGITTKEILAHLTPSDNLHIFQRESYFPKLSQLTSLRHELGVRTGLNAIEKLLNPAKSPYAIISAFHKPYIQKYIDLYHDRYERLLIVKGLEGAPEVFSDGEYWLIEGEKVTQGAICLADFSISHDKAKVALDFKTALNLSENPTTSLKQLAKLNAALHLFLSKKAPSIEEGFKMLSS